MVDPSGKVTAHSGGNDIEDRLRKVGAFLRQIVSTHHQGFGVRNLPGISWVSAGLRVWRALLTSSVS